MKKVGLVAMIVIAAMLIAGCGNSNNADDKTTVNESLAVSSSVGNTENSNSEIVKEIQSSTEVLFNRNIGNGNEYLKRNSGNQ